MQDKLIYKKLFDIQKDIEPIKKEQYNKFQKYNFRGIDDVYNNLSEIFRKHEVLPMPEILHSDIKMYTTEKDGIKTTSLHSFYTVQYRFIALDGSSEKISIACEGFDKLDKGTSKAMSNAHKVALLQMFMIPTDDGKDSDQSDIKQEENDLVKKAITALEKLEMVDQKKKAILATVKSGKANPEFLQRIIDGQI